MSPRCIVLAFIASAFVARVATADASPLAPFTSDVCTGVRDRSRAGEDWSACCIAHDRAYWAGGTAPERAAADEALRACRLGADRHPGAARTMWLGVRFFAHPAWPVPYRWGYGWRWGRGYRALAPEESAAVAAGIARFCADPAAPATQKRVVCATQPD